MNTPVINVGILTDKKINFVFNGEYLLDKQSHPFTGEQSAFWENNSFVFNGQSYNELVFNPIDSSSSFELKAVTIGIDFHWQRKEDQRFNGALKLVAQKEGIVVINQIDLEEYLTSVISSEMSATASKELLKAHAVISRGWLLAQIEKNTQLIQEENKYNSCYQNEKELIRWYDREDHLLFDVCADDHCQRYQGITKASTPIVKEVILETRGQVLSFNNKICDTRFSKCCGGVTEIFEHCWEPISHPYLATLRDDKDSSFPDLTKEEEAEKWINTLPKAFCNTKDKTILSQVLNNYDQETTDFYRWKVSYTQQELSSLIYKKSSIDFGEIIDMIPLKRGTSSRIEKLKIIGTNKTFTIGKELEIRRILSETHLYSSAFTVEKRNITDNIPGLFILTGAGWGHGVGLCQIGAAVMGSQGYNYQKILTHYFPGASIDIKY